MPVHCSYAVFATNAGLVKYESWKKCWSVRLCSSISSFVYLSATPGTMKLAKVPVRLHLGAAGREPIVREFALAKCQSLLLRWAQSEMCKDGSRLPDYKAFVGNKELELDAPISALVGADGDDGMVMVQIYFYDSSVFQFGDNDATTMITKEIAALDEARRSGEIRK